jgi:purine nucleosidase
MAEVMPASGLEEPRPPFGVALDADLAGRVDALLAVALLNGLSARNEARRIVLNVSRASLNAARFADVVAEFYPTLPLNAGYSTIGICDGVPPSADAPVLSGVLARKGPDGAPLYASNVRRLVDTADSAVLLRNLLLAEHDGNAAVALAGPATGLARVLALNGARSQIAAKTQHLVVALGAYSSSRVEASVAADISAARKLFSEWPTPVIAVGAEVGEAVPYPSSRLEEGLAWAPAHPVAAAYRAMGRMPFDAPTTALAAVLFAAHPAAGYFKVSEPGVIRVLDDGRTQFAAKAGGTHRHLIVDPAQKERLLGLYTALVSAPPAPRPVRRKPPAADVPPAGEAPPPGSPPPGAPASGKP